MHACMLAQATQQSNAELPISAHIYATPTLQWLTGRLCMPAWKLSRGLGWEVDWFAVRAIQSKGMHSNPEVALTFVQPNIFSTANKQP
jgi:hypothetical protein